MYVEDGKDFDYAGKSTNCFAWGWLSSDHEYQVGWDSEEEKNSFLEKLMRLEVVDIYRGWHTDGILGLDHNAKVSSNGSIKFIVDGVTYVAPTAVTYYIKELDYLPPLIVIKALMGNHTARGRNMKITPDMTIETEVKEVETIQGIRERIQRFTEHDPLTARVLEVARANNMTAQDAMVLLAYHALMKIETLEELVLKIAQGSVEPVNSEVN